MRRNEPSQWTVFAFDAISGAPVTGDQNNITANMYIDAGLGRPLADTAPDELEAGHYSFKIAADETDGDHLTLIAKSTSPDVTVIGVPGALWTRTQATPDDPKMDGEAVDVTLYDNADTVITITRNGDKSDGISACAFPDYGYCATSGEVALEVNAEYKAGDDVTTIAIKFPASGIGRTGNYSVTHDTGNFAQLLQVGTYYRDPKLKTCAE